MSIPIPSAAAPSPRGLPRLGSVVSPVPPQVEAKLAPEDTEAIVQLFPSSYFTATTAVLTSLRLWPVAVALRRQDLVPKVVLIGPRADQVMNLLSQTPVSGIITLQGTLAALGPETLSGLGNITLITEGLPAAGQVTDSVFKIITVNPPTTTGLDIIPGHDVIERIDTPTATVASFRQSVIQGPPPTLRAKYNPAVWRRELEDFLRSEFSGLVEANDLDFMFPRDDPKHCGPIWSIWDMAFTNETFSRQDYDVLEKKGDLILKLIFQDFFEEEMSRQGKVVSSGMISQAEQFYLSKNFQPFLSEKIGYPRYVRKDPELEINDKFRTDVSESVFGALYRVGELIGSGVGLRYARVYLKSIFHRALGKELMEPVGSAITTLKELSDPLKDQGQTIGQFKATKTPQTGRFFNAEVYLTPRQVQFLSKTFGANFSDVRMIEVDDEEDETSSSPSRVYQIATAGGTSQKQANNEAAQRALEFLASRGVSTETIQNYHERRIFQGADERALKLAKDRMSREGGIRLELKEPKSGASTTTRSIVLVMVMPPNKEVKLGLQSFPTAGPLYRKEAINKLLANYAYGVDEQEEGEDEAEDPSSVCPAPGPSRAGAGTRVVEEVVIPVNPEPLIRAPKPSPAPPVAAVVTKTAPVAPSSSGLTTTRPKRRVEAVFRTQK